MATVVCAVTWAQVEAWEIIFLGADVQLDVCKMENNVFCWFQFKSYLCPSPKSVQ